MSAEFAFRDFVDYFRNLRICRFVGGFEFPGGIHFWLKSGTQPNNTQTQTHTYAHACIPLCARTLCFENGHAFFVFRADYAHNPLHFKA